MTTTTATMPSRPIPQGGKICRCNKCGSLVIPQAQPCETVCKVCQSTDLVPESLTERVLSGESPSEIMGHHTQVILPGRSYREKDTNKVYSCRGFATHKSPLEETTVVIYSISGDDGLNLYTMAETEFAEEFTEIDPSYSYLPTDQ